MNPTGLPDATVQHWTRQGYLRLPHPGTGAKRRYPRAELRAAAAIDSVRRLGGTPPGSGGTEAAHRRLRRDVARVARANPPGKTVELPCPVPWIRMVLIVPEGAE